MQIIDLLSPDRVRVANIAHSKKRLLELIADLLTDSERGITGRAAYDSLCSREKLGSTGLGNGVAIPHGRLAEFRDAIGTFVRLRDPIDFESPDRQPVDLIFAMLVPENSNDEHLELLAQLAELFNDEQRREQLRSADSSTDILNLLENWQNQRATG